MEARAQKRRARRLPLVIAGALADAARRIGPASDTPRLDAELLMAHALGITREALLLGRHGDIVPPGFPALVERRVAQEPIAYIVGRRAFWTIELAVTPAVLIPRPDSETLIEAAVAHFGARAPARILDLGTGSGALLLAALDQWPGAAGLGIDISPAALAVARANAARLGLADRAAFAAGEWEDAAGPADLLLCNPPYIERDAALAPQVLREPAGALFAGADGLDAYRRIAPLLPRLIAPGGIACIEIGSGQAAAVTAFVAAAGCVARVLPDLAGHDRCLAILG